MGGYFFISTMVYNTMIRIKAMYSIVSTPSRKKGQKASPLQNQRGKTANRMATPVCIVADDTGKRNKHNKKAAGNPAAFRFLSELLRVYKGQGITACCARELRPGSAWLCGRRFPGDPRNCGVCNRFYALSRLLVCADPGHAPKYAKKRLEFLSLFCSAIAPAGMTW